VRATWATRVCWPRCARGRSGRRAPATIAGALQALQRTTSPVCWSPYTYTRTLCEPSVTGRGGEGGGDSVHVTCTEVDAHFMDIYQSVPQQQPERAPATRVSPAESARPDAVAAFY
jgi:hypothetical protein